MPQEPIGLHINFNSRIIFRTAVAEVFSASIDSTCSFALDSFEHDLSDAPERRRALVKRDSLALRRRIESTKNSSFYLQLQIRKYEKRAQFQLGAVRVHPISVCLQATWNITS